MTIYRIRSVDVPHSETVGEFFEHLERFKARVATFVASGPGGGNPCFTLDFPSRANAMKFLEEYDPTDGVELHPITCVAGTLDEILADVELDRGKE